MTHQHCKFFAHPVICLTEWAYKLPTTGGASNCSIYGLHLMCMQCTSRALLLISCCSTSNTAS